MYVYIYIFFFCFFSFFSHGYRPLSTPLSNNDLTSIRAKEFSKFNKLVLNELVTKDDGER